MKVLAEGAGVVTPSGVALGAVVLAVLAALGFATEAILAKRGIAAGGEPILASLTVAAVAIVAYWSVVATIVDIPTFAQRDPSGYLIFLLAGAIGSGLGVLLLYQGVDRVGASVNTAVANSRPLFAAVVGFAALGESLSPATVVGIVILVAGIVVIALSRGGDIRGWQPRALVFPLAAAFAFGVGNVIRRYGLTRTELTVFEGIAINAIGGFSVLLAYILFVRGTDVLRAPRRAYGWFLCTGSATALALLALFAALERERVAIVDSIAAAAPLFTLLFTAMFLRELEVVTRRVVIGAGLVVLGGILIVGV